MNAGRLIKTARLEAGLTQTDLAERIGTTQSAVARLESPRANPRVETVRSAFAAMGRQVELTTRPALPQGPDPTLFAAHLALTPLDRVRAHDSASRSVSGLLSRATPLDREA